MKTRSAHSLLKGLICLTAVLLAVCLGTAWAEGARTLKMGMRGDDVLSAQRRLTELGYTGKQGIYASLNWVRARFSDPGFDPWRDNLWIARFSDDLDYAGTYDMWQCTFSAPGADYGVQSETVDLDFVMRPFKFPGVSACNGKTAAPVLLNDTYTDELHMDGKGAYATLATNEPGKEDGGRRVYWTTSDKTVATVDKNGTVRARTDSGECTITCFKSCKSCIYISM